VLDPMRANKSRRSAASEDRSAAQGQPPKARETRTTAASHKKDAHEERSAHTGVARTSPGLEVSEDVLQGRAAMVLATLLAPDVRPARTLLGGRVKASTDVHRTLRSYYTSLEHARRIVHAHPETAPVFSQLLLQVSVPDRARSVLYESIELPPAPEPEPAGPLGHLADGQYTVMYPGDMSRVIEGYTSGRLAFDDDFVDTRVFGRSVWPLDLTEFMSHPDVRTGACLLDELRIYARQGEIQARRIEGPRAIVSSWAPVVDRVPRTSEGMAVLGRLLSAFNVDPKSIVIDGVPLPSYRPAARSARDVFGPIGDVARFEKDPVAWNEAWSDERLESTQIDDPTIRGLWSTGDGLSLGALLAGPPGKPMSHEPTFVAGLLHLAARTRELGLMTVLPRWRAEGIVRHVAPPDGPELVEAMYRAAVAFGWDPERTDFRGRPLAEAWREAHPGSDKPRGLLRPWSSGQELGPDVDPSAALAALDARRTDALAMSDSSARDFFGVVYRDSRHWSLIFARANGSPDIARAIVRLVDRTLEIGPGEHGLDDRTLADSFESGFTAMPNIFDDPEVIELLVRMTDRAGQSMPGLQERPEVSAAVRRRCHWTLLERAPLDERTPFRLSVESIPAPIALWDDPECTLRLHDRHLAPFARDEMRELLEKLPPADVFKLFARGCESSSEAIVFKATARGFLAAPIPGRCVTPQSIAAILSLARAADVEIAGIRYLDPDAERPARLIDHPAMPGRAQALDGLRRASERLDRGIAELTRTEAVGRGASEASEDRGSSRSRKPPKAAPLEIAPSKRSEVLQSLLSEAPAIEISPLLHALIQAKRSGTLEPVQADTSVLDGLMHIGAIAVIAGLATRIADDEIERALVAKGYDPEAARTWADVAGALARLDPQEIAFAVRDLTPSPPDFSSLPIRVALAKRSLDWSLLEASASSFGERHPVAFARALLERALSADSAGDRSRILDLLENSVSHAWLGPLEVARALDDLGQGELGPTSFLAGRVLDPLDAAVELVDSDGILAAFERLARYVGPDRAAAEVMRRAYAKDLRGVLPLCEAETAREPMEWALTRLRALADDALELADLDEPRVWQAIDAAVLTSVRKGRVVDGEAMVGIAEAFQRRLISRATLEEARDALSRDELTAIASRVASSEARAVLLGQPRRSVSAILGPKLTELGSPATPLQRGLAAPRSSERPQAAAVKRGPSAPGHT
jgi:hypothetical protein